MSFLYGLPISINDMNLFRVECTIRISGRNVKRVMQHVTSDYNYLKTGKSRSTDPQKCLENILLKYTY